MIGLANVELAGVDRELHAAKIDLVQVARVRRVEAALGQATMQRHLAAFEALDAHARARGLALAAAARLLALARTDAATDPDTGLGRAFGLSLISLSFMARSSLAFDDAHEMGDLGDHPLRRGRVLIVERRPILLRPRPFSVCALVGRTADRAAGLNDRDGGGVSHV